MRNRFASKTGKSGRERARQGFLSLLLFVFLFALFVYGVNGVSAVSEEERLRAVERAVTRATVQCYAVEGQYSPSLRYLEEHYGLSYNSRLYIVQYDIFASNIRPTILVLPRHAENQEDRGFLDAF